MIPQDSSSTGILRPASLVPPPRWFTWLAWLALAGYAVFLGLNMTAVAGGSDSSGYLNSARLLAAGKLRTELRVPAEFASVPLNRLHFSPAGFDTFPVHEALAPSYPTGLPLHLALSALLFGWTVGPFLIQLAAGVGAVGLGYWTARALGLDYLLAAAGAVMLAAFPVFIFTSIQTLSDTLATAWTLAALYAALRGRASGGWAAASGAALGIAVLVRPTNVLLAPALVILLGLNWRRLAVFVAGGLPCAVWLALYNHFLYGGAFKSGYGEIYAAFSWEWGAVTAVHFAKWLALLLPAVMLVLPLAAAGHRATRGRELLALAWAAGANIVLYLFYSVSHDVWWCLRFILPGVAVLILAGLLGLEALARGPGRRWPRAFRPAAALCLAGWATGLSWYWSRELHLMLVPVYERVYGAAAELLCRLAPPNAVVVSCAFSGAVYYHTSMSTMIFDWVAPEEFARYEALARSAGRPIYAVIFDIEEEAAIRQHCPGRWRRIASAGNIGLWLLDAPRLAAPSP